MSAPQGFAYYPRVFDGKETKALLGSLLAEKGWEGVSGARGARQVLQYGKRYVYSSRGLGEAPAPPERLAGLVPLEDGSCSWDQIIVNRYLSGQKITPHVDNVKHFGGCVACVSLGAAAVVTFATPSGRVVFRQKVEDGSLYVMTGDARYTYTHQADPPQGEMRLSITFRTLGPGTEARVRSPAPGPAPGPAAQPPPDDDPIWADFGL
ncbi:MAG TPA: alpha-ketoglutarate-dependent dioxygenase AlkB [Elusimicrobiota bacterium]|jgi:hypothetical protein|nr:alpha-ketoglutarate-dependent dioxygenase AlkB [Elusimicrobiota bacterium]